MRLRRVLSFRPLLQLFTAVHPLAHIERNEHPDEEKDARVADARLDQRQSHKAGIRIGRRKPVDPALSKNDRRDQHRQSHGPRSKKKAPSELRELLRRILHEKAVDKHRRNDHVRKQRGQRLAALIGHLPRPVKRKPDQHVQRHHEDLLQNDQGHVRLPPFLSTCRAYTR